MTYGELPPTAGLPLYASDFLRPWQDDFVATASALIGTPHAGLACSGTACLVTILSTLQRLAPQRHKVIVPAYSCPLVVLAIARCGLKAIVCDVAPASFDLDADALGRLCDTDTLAVIPTHLGGRVADVARTLAIAQAQGAFVVEDAAQSLGARQNGISVGLAGDAGFFSFAVGKGLTLFEGGLWVCSKAELAAEIRRTAAEMLPASFAQEVLRCVQLLGYAMCYRPTLLRWVYGVPLRQELHRGRLEEAVGDVFDTHLPLHRVGRWRRSVGTRALARLPAFLDATERQAHALRAHLLNLDGIEVISDAASSAQGVWPLLMVRLRNVEARDAALAKLWEAGLGVSRMFIHALPDYAYLQQWTGAADCPNARDLAARMLTVSNSLWLNEATTSKILTVLAHHA